MGSWHVKTKEQPSILDEILEPWQLIWHQDPVSKNYILVLFEKNSEPHSYDIELDNSGISNIHIPMI